jgi:uncharacterized protein
MIETERDRHLFAPGRKRILSIDGGGVRGILALAFLERLEALLSESGQGVRLCDYFDLIGGTSTGAIIATGLALGFSAKSIHDFYVRMSPKVFRAPWLRLPGWQSKFDAEALRREIAEVVGARTLDSADIQTGLGVMLKRLDRGGAWIVTNNPRGKYWDDPADRSFIGNRNYALADIVRASTAAPHYFDPQEIEIVKGEAPALFVDGGLTAHNDPALGLFMCAVLPAYRFEWKLGAENLTVVSLGTGTHRGTVNSRTLRRASSVKIALTSLTQQIAEAQQLTLTMMSWLGRGGSQWPINSELGDLRNVEPPFGALFRFLRYDVRLEDQWLRDTLGLTIAPRDIAAARRLDNPEALDLLFEIGRRAAERQMTAGDFTST